MYMLDITFETDAESMAIRERMESLGILLASKEKPTAYRGISPYTIGGDKVLYHGGGGDIKLTAEEFMAKPINYLLSL